jgi:hypothetical protein
LIALSVCNVVTYSDYSGLVGPGAVVGSLMEAPVNRHLILATIGAVSLLPASILVSSGLSRNAPPLSITQLVLVLGGIALSMRW